VTIESPAVSLYGPPASGKDTITRALGDISPAYRLFPRLKCGAGRTAGYRVITAAELQRLRDDRLVIYENDRYGSIYAVDRPQLDMMLGEAMIPVVHIGQVQAITALRRYPAGWLTVLLWCSRTASATRLRNRADSDVEARLQAWSQTADDLLAAPGTAFDMVFRTDQWAPRSIATAIHQGLSSPTAIRQPIEVDLADLRAETER